MTSAGPTTHHRLDLLPGELWWGGAVADGMAMPFGREPHRRDLATSAGFLTDDTQGPNQSMPLLISNRGRYIWSENPFVFEFTESTLEVDGDAIVVGTSGSSLAEAFRETAAAHFPPSGSMPSAAMFTGPQYNTWIESPYEPTQEGVLAYVRGLLEAGFPPGLVIIDDQWSVDYGNWQFDRTRFPDPTEMTRVLHEWGCTVMLWLVPFVSPDSAVFRSLLAQGLLLVGDDGEVAIRRWWNGYSGILDATNPASVQWLNEQLSRLVDEHGIDGFKFDGGDFRDFRASDRPHDATSPAEQCEAWARIGLGYPVNEYRASWKMGGKALAQRLHDKPPTWGHDGLATLIPEGIAQGLTGHAFVCPDMVGGGDLERFELGSTIDQELFVRYAQCAALFPMMQFSLSPWRVLDPDHLAAVVAAVSIRQSLVPEILRLAREAAVTGEPIIRPLAYNFAGYEDVNDQFLVGESILVAPVLEQGVTRREVTFPPGHWVSSDATVYVGPAIAELPVQLSTLPWFRREVEASLDL